MKGEFFKKIALTKGEEEEVQKLFRPVSYLTTAIKYTQEKGTVYGSRGGRESL